MEQDAKAKVERYIAAHGFNATAKALGASRTGLGSYIAGCAREGTKLLIEQRSPRLAIHDSNPPPNGAH